ncbi:MAG: short-chain dehydrogenase, partial [Actinomycetota bacterium]|nr:short-chain dehydrogenase [Actinomycetota bacterium]
MPDASEPLTATSSAGQWLEHPVGGPLLRELLAQAGMDESALTPALGLPLQTLADMSQGQMPQSVVDELVMAANGGTMPEFAVDPSLLAPTVPGRFADRTVIVT